jgi:2-polyprenyl-6-methoxyphenol hydroxylase-like FAD-dependent oxidoreductase
MFLKIAIVGAGIGGLSAAAALRLAGHHVEVRKNRDACHFFFFRLQLK